MTYFLIAAVITKKIDVSAELTKSTRLPTKEAKAKMETHSITTEAKISSFPI